MRSLHFAEITLHLGKSIRRSHPTGFLQFREMTPHQTQTTFRQAGIRFIEDSVTGEIGVSLQKKKKRQ